MNLNTDELKAQARKYLKVRPQRGLPEHARLEVVITLRTMSGVDLLPPVSNQATILRPLQEELREVHLNTIHRTMRAVTDVAVKAYDAEFKRHAAQSKGKEERIPKSVVVPMYPEETDPQVASMLDQTKSKPKPDDEATGPAEPA